MEGTHRTMSEQPLHSIEENEKELQERWVEADADFEALTYDQQFYVAELAAVLSSKTTNPGLSWVGAMARLAVDTLHHNRRKKAEREKSS